MDGIPEPRQCAGVPVRPTEKLSLTDWNINPRAASSDSRPVGQGPRAERIRHYAQSIACRATGGRKDLYEPLDREIRRRCPHGDTASLHQRRFRGLRPSEPLARPAHGHVVEN